MLYWWPVWLPEVTAIIFDNKKMNVRGKDNDAFARLRPFPNMVGSYKYGHLEVPTNNDLKK